MLVLFVSILLFFIFQAVTPNRDICASLKIDSPQYRYNFPLQRLYLIPTNQRSDINLFMPIYSNYSPFEKNIAIHRIVIVIHGASNDANNTFCSALYAAQQSNTTNMESVLIIAPLFDNFPISDFEFSLSCASKTNGMTSAYWSHNNWISGANDVQNYTSSYDILDALVAWFTDPSRFSSVSEVIFAGFSAGGQTINRYAWATTIDQQTPISECINYSDSVTKYTASHSTFYIISDPSSYLYLDSFRPSADCLSAQLYDTGVNATCDLFTDISFNQSISESCNTYDTWKYGVSAFPTSSDAINLGTFSYLSKYTQGTTLVAMMSAAYLEKDIHFVLGEKDVCNCNTEGFRNSEFCYPSNHIDSLYNSSTLSQSNDICQQSDGYSSNSNSNSNSIDKDGVWKDTCKVTNNTDHNHNTTNNHTTTAMPCSPNLHGDIGCCDTYPDSIHNDLSISCESMLQGSNRLQRGLFYIDYLKDYTARMGQLHTPPPLQSNFEMNVVSTTESKATSTISSISTTNKGSIANHSFYIVNDMAHDSEMFYSSDVMQSLAFHTED